ncbi:MAG: hydroxymethylbilane synthase [Hyphomicrobiales bacterium]|nr:hydroxymethylbilane synthase [Hyphomicrobiales bacterium]
MASQVLFTLGTRGSPLALAQAQETRRLLAAAQGWDEAAIALDVIKTTGDLIQDRPLAEAGGKGLFTKEIDAALIEGRIDAAVHSAKDLPTQLPEGLTIAGFLEREDVRDAFISSVAESFATLPPGARLGAASLRRQAQARRLRPDLKVELLRGNVETRLRKAESGAIDATLLALAGLKRLGLAHRARGPLDLDSFLPAVGQGAIALTARAGDARALAALAAISHAATFTALAAERAFLAELEGSCRTPIAGHARIEDGALLFVGQVLREDGSEAFDVRLSGAPQDAARLGRDAGRDVKGRLPPGVLRP